jgi:hypothetical protein
MRNLEGKPEDLSHERRNQLEDITYADAGSSLDDDNVVVIVC